MNELSIYHEIHFKKQSPLLTILKALQVDTWGVVYCVIVWSAFCFQYFSAVTSSGYTAIWKAKDSTLGFGQVQEVAVSVTHVQVKYLTHSCKPRVVFKI